LSVFFSDFYFFFLFWLTFGLVSLVYIKTFLREKPIAA
jgi:hypothetical protein